MPAKIDMRNLIVPRQLIKISGAELQISRSLFHTEQFQVITFFLSHIIPPEHLEIKKATTVRPLWLNNNPGCSFPLVNNS